MYLFAIASAPRRWRTTWEEHPPWLRAVAVVVGIATVVSLRWRRTHPGAVGIGSRRSSAVLTAPPARW